MYESYNPGPQKGEAIAIEFLQMDGIDGLVFAIEKIGALLTTTTEKVDLGWLLSHLCIFGRRLFPLDIQVLLNLVDQDRERVGLVALRALSQITHPAVRQLAFRLVETRAKWRGQAIELLARNFGPGDHVIALRWFEAEDDLETLHSFGMDLTDLWEQHPDEETEVPMLLAMYERGPCSFCREKTVRRLIERGALTEELRLECSFDANGDIRDLAKGSPPHAAAGLRDRTAVSSG